jgi:hypothetical protein
MPALASGELPNFMSQTPGDFGLAAFDAHYSMAPFFIGDDEALVITGRWPECRFGNVCLWNRFQQTLDEALVITGRWPECRFGNVCLWNRFQQTLDYTTRTVSLNREQTARAGNRRQFPPHPGSRGSRPAELAGHRGQSVWTGVLAFLPGGGRG